MPLKNRQLSIPGGFDWVEAATGWEFRSDSFLTTRDAIIQHRQANPRHNLSLNWSRIEFEMEQRYEAKLKAMPGGDQWLVLSSPDTGPPVFSRPRSRSVAAVGDKAENAKAGIGAIREWLGSGLEPVSQELGNHRAAVCVECPMNQDGSFWQNLEAKAAKGVKLLVEAKNEMKLTTPDDPNLKSCMACDCWMPTKIWVPIETIINHTRTETLAKLDSKCWITNEKRQLSN